MSTVKRLCLPRQSTGLCPEISIGLQKDFHMHLTAPSLTQPSGRLSCSALGHGGGWGVILLRTCYVSGTGLGVFLPHSNHRPAEEAP